MNVLESLKNHFTFTIKEQRGIFVLSVLIVILMLIRFTLPYLFRPETTDFTSFDENLRRLEALFADTTEQDTLKPKPSFNSPESRWKGYNPATGAASRPHKPAYSPERLLELNAADSVSLVRLKGIGPVLASRIIKYRKALGGYTDVNQLREVYGMDSLTFQSIRPYLAVDPSRVKPLLLNQATFKELLHHPYLEYDEVKRIFQYRDKYGSFSSVESLYDLEGMDSLRIRRIVPYLVVSSDPD